MEPQFLAGFNLPAADNGIGFTSLAMIQAHPAAAAFLLIVMLDRCQAGRHFAIPLLSRNLVILPLLAGVIIGVELLLGRFIISRPLGALLAELADFRR